MCYEFIEVDSTQCQLCKQYFCYGCLLIRGEMETHARTKIEPEKNQCKVTVGELKRNKLDSSII
jgi:hypothetical protein